MASQGVTILGATGSIGLSTLDVVARHPDKYHLVGVSAFSNVDQMLAICQRYQPPLVVMVDVAAAKALRTALASPHIQVLSGTAALVELARDGSSSIVMAAIVGAAGLAPSLAAVEVGKRVLLANKESLVTAGHLFMDAVAQHDAVLLPIDSEHNAIFQCLPNGRDSVAVKKILLTASGGPFRQRALETFAAITPDEACAHPNWSMGRKISVDSATMMNKGLELIEACWLFGKQAADIDIVVHPQSIIHSMVAYCDGSVIAQLGNPDMRTPIAYGLAWPERIEAGVELLDIIAAKSLTFEAPDEQRFPLLRIAREAWQAGGNAAAIMNAANEVAVEAFLAERIGFTAIADIIQACLAKMPNQPITGLDEVNFFDARARVVAAELI